MSVLHVQIESEQTGLVCSGSITVTDRGGLASKVAPKTGGIMRPLPKENYVPPVKDRHRQDGSSDGRCPEDHSDRRAAGWSAHVVGHRDRFGQGWNDADWSPRCMEAESLHGQGRRHRRREVEVIEAEQDRLVTQTRIQTLGFSFFLLSRSHGKLSTYWQNGESS